MSHPAHIHQIAVKLLLPPISVETTSVAAALGISYQTIYKWKKDALAAQDATKPQDKSTPTTKGSKRASQIKKESSRAASQPTRTRSNEHIRVSSTRGDDDKNFKLVGGRLLKSMPLSMFSP